jgi:hypothetical protein
MATFLIWRNRMKQIIWVFMLLMLLCPNAQAESITVSWEAPTTNEDGTELLDLAGYKIYYGNTQSGSYNQVIDVGIPGQNLEGREESTVNVAPEGQYYFAVTAYDTAWNESDYSNEVEVNFSGLPDTNRWLVTMDDIEGIFQANYLEPGKLTIWGDGGFFVRVDEVATINFKANLFGNGSCLDNPLSLVVGSEEFMVDTTQAFYSVFDGPLVEFNFSDCHIADVSNVNLRITGLRIVETIQDTTAVIDISSGQVILEWDFIDKFVDNSLIDTSQYEIYTELSYREVGSTWQFITAVAQPDTSYDISILRDSLIPGDYEFSIQPRSNIRFETDFRYGEITFSTGEGWTGKMLLPLLSPQKHQIFRIIIRE